MAEKQPAKSRKSRGKSRSKAKKVDPVALWGDTASLPSLADGEDVTTPDPLAIVRSLGKAPIPGSPAERYFALVYMRASGLATALGSIARGTDAPSDAPVRED